MRNLPELNVHVPWTDVVRVLGLSAPAAVPCRARCPLCRGRRLTIYDDTISVGQWHYCFDCRHAGDMIELVAAAWKVDVGAAVSRLAAEGVDFPGRMLEPEVVAAYAKYGPKSRARMAAFAAAAGKHLPRANSRELTALRERMRLSSHLVNSRWDVGPANMFGGAACKDVTRACIPRFAEGPAVTAHDRVFVGGNWREVLVVPFYDLPGRVCAVYCVGRNATRADRVFRRAPGFGSRRNTVLGTAEAGLACHWAIEHSRATFGGHLFACGDAFLAARLHLKHFNMSNRPLPLVAYYDGPEGVTKKAWRSVEDRKIVVWGWAMTADLVNQAVVTDGLLSVTRLDRPNSRADVDHYVRDNDAQAVLRKALRRALPWRVALKRWAKTVDDGAVETLMHSLEVYGPDVVEAVCSAGKRLRRLSRRRAAPKSILIPRWRIIEKNRAWTGEPTKTKTRQAREDIREGSTRVMNAVLRLDGTYAAKGPNGEVAVYKGRLLFEDGEYPFEIPADELHANAPSKLRTLLAVNRPGAVLLVGKNWGPQLVEIAAAFGDSG